MVPIGKQFYLNKRKNSYIEPNKWNNLLKQKDVRIIDVRKSFEYHVGTFKGAKNPNLDNFRDFPKYFKKFNKNLGSPDGMTIDINKNLWVCHFRGAQISVFNTKGKKIHVINFPAKNITNCTFGGKNNSEIFVTSAIKSMNKSDKK